MRRRTLVSAGLALLAFAVLTALDLLIFSVMAERDRLESRNDAERTMGALLAGLRDHDTFGAAIESAESLRARVLGVGAYSSEGVLLYSWGTVPASYKKSSVGTVPDDGMLRLYLDDPKQDSIVLIHRPFRVGPPPPPRARHEAGEPPREGRGPSGFLSTTLRNAESVYLEVREPGYWRNRRLETLLFPLIEAALAALILFVRSLILRNGEYRRRIEEQENLVVLGTAASTLAHEIKNPLLSIRIQTHIMERTYPEAARRELAIINDEVERLSALSQRVGDYLRAPEGKPSPVDPADIASEVGMRMCGRDIVRPGEAAPPKVLIDPERLRSVLENLLRNALESGGPEEGIAIELGAEEGGARIDVLDRGRGIEAEAAAKLFDPFFTTKSRGTGIGLAVCRRFVAAAGGSIALDGRPGGGCRARVILPSGGAGA
jgi:two-component system, NtrC family, sensor histidine kinase HydH